MIDATTNKKVRDVAQRMHMAALAVFSASLARARIAGRPVALSPAEPLEDVADVDSDSDDDTDESQTGAPKKAVALTITIAGCKVKCVNHATTS